MQKYFLWFLFFFLFYNENLHYSHAENCGCKVVRECYSTMVEELLVDDEAACVSDAAVSSSMIYIYLKAITQYCPNITEVHAEYNTYESRQLFEVIISTPKEVPFDKEDERPIFVIDAGQEADSDSVGFALYLLEQLVSCQENNDLISTVRWVILPSTNPDGLEYMRYHRPEWRKNMKLFDDGISFGVDVSRNFEGDWMSCPKVDSGFSPVYPGPNPASENETIFIQGVLNKYRTHLKVYLSIRRDGHSIGYPLAHDSAPSNTRSQLERLAALVSAKVNQRAGGVHHFRNQSIFELNGQAHCGHSVDYAHVKMGVMNAYEMRVFLGSENRIMSKFQSLPKGYEATLRSGYYSGIRELYSIVIKEAHNKYYTL